MPLPVFCAVIEGNSPCINDCNWPLAELTDPQISANLSSALRSIAELDLPGPPIFAYDPLRNSRLYAIKEANSSRVGQSLAQRNVVLNNALNGDFTRDTERCDLVIYQPFGAICELKSHGPITIRVG